MRALICLVLVSLACAIFAAPAFDDGRPRRYSKVFTLREQLDQRYRQDLVTYAVAFPTGQMRPESLRLWDDKQNAAIPFQITWTAPSSGRTAEVSFWVDSLDIGEARTYTLYWDNNRRCKPATFPTTAITETKLPNGAVEVVGKQYGLRFAGNAAYTPALSVDKAPGALIAFKGADGVWRGKGFFEAEFPIAKQTLTTLALESGPLWKTYRQRTEFANGDWHVLTVQVFPDTDYARFSEYSSYRGEVESWRRGQQFVFEPSAWGSGWGDFKHAGQFVFSLRDNFDPDTIYAPNTFSKGIVKTPLAHGDPRAYCLSWHIHPYWTNAWSAVYSSDPNIHDAIGTTITNAAGWSPAVAPPVLLDDAAGHAQMTFPLRVDRHYYLIFTTREKVVKTPEQIAQSETQSKIRYWGTASSHGKRITPSSCYIWEMRNKLTDFPLNKIKDWVLDYNPMQDTHPRVLWDPQDQQLDEITKRFAQVPEFKKFYQEGPVVQYLLTGKHGPSYPEEKNGIRMDWDFCGIEGWIRDNLELGNGANVYIYSTGNYSRESMLLADGYLGELTPAERANWVKWVLAGCYIAADYDHWKYQGEQVILANFNDIGFSALGVGAAMFPKHPKAKEWAARALSGGNFVLETTISKDGVGLENIGNYHPFSWNLWVKNAIALKRAGFPEYAGDPRFKRTIMYMIEQMTPRDPGMDNSRMLPPVGHHPGAGMRRFGEFHWGVQLWEKSDPTLASYCQWAWEENGKMMGALSRPLPLNLLFGKLDYPAKQPPLKSMAWDNAGWVFRSQVGTPRESYFLLKCGDERGHHHGDEGSFHMYGKGVLLAADGLDLSSVNPQQFEHCFLSFGNPNYDGLPAGKWHKFATTDAVDYGIGTIPSGTRKSSYDREVLFLKSKDPERPEYFVMLDRVQGPEAPRFDFDVQSTKPEAGFQGDPRWIMYPGIDLPGYRVGLDLIFLTPEKPQPVFRKGESFAGYMGTWNIKEHWIMNVPGTPGQTFATLMYPRPFGWQPPKVTQLAPGVTLVEHQSGKDYIFLGEKPFTYTGQGIDFTGRVGIIRELPGERSVTLVEGSKLSYGGEVVTKAVRGREQ
ncbi:MAG: hypothetical protein ACYDBB_22225 [Armatimonadota bacterium]